MNKIIIMSLFLFSSIFLSNLLESSAYKRIQNNYIFFEGNIHTKDINFKITDHCISPRQPYDNTVGRSSSSRRLTDTKVFDIILGLNIKAGRHRSVSVVNCLKENIMHAKNINNNFTFHNEPHHLNFAVIGTLSINGKYFDDIVLAQGHTLLKNNWWFGGKRCAIYTEFYGFITNSVTCTARDNTKWCFTRGLIGNTLTTHTSANVVRVDMGECSKTIK